MKRQADKLRPAANCAGPVKLGTCLRPDSMEWSNRICQKKAIPSARYCLEDRPTVHPAAILSCSTFKPTETYSKLSISSFWGEFPLLNASSPRLPSFLAPTVDPNSSHQATIFLASGSTCTTPCQVIHQFDQMEMYTCMGANMHIYIYVYV